MRSAEEKLESGGIHCFEMVVLNLLSFIRPDVEGHNLADRRDGGRGSPG